MSVRASERERGSTAFVFISKVTLPFWENVFEEHLVIIGFIWWINLMLINKISKHRVSLIYLNPPKTRYSQNYSHIWPTLERDCYCVGMLACCCISVFTLSNCSEVGRQVVTARSRRGSVVMGITLPEVKVVRFSWYTRFLITNGDKSEGKWQIRSF